MSEPGGIEHKQPLPVKLKAPDKVVSNIKTNISKVVRAAIGKGSVVIGQHEEVGAEDVRKLLMEYMEKRATPLMTVQSRVGILRALGEMNRTVEEINALSSEAELLASSEQLATVKKEIKDARTEIERLSNEQSKQAAKKRSSLLNGQSAAEKLEETLQSDFNDKASESRERQKNIGDVSTTIRVESSEEVEKFVQNEFRNLRSSYREMLAEVLKDGTLGRDVGESYTAKFITPRLEELVGSGRITTEYRAEIAATLTGIFNGGGATWNQRWELLRAYTQDAKINSISESLSAIVNGVELKTVAKLMSHLYATEKQSVIDQINESLHMDSFETKSFFDQVDRGEFHMPSAPINIDGDMNLIEVYNDLFYDTFNTKNNYSDQIAETYMMFQSLLNVESLPPDIAEVITNKCEENKRYILDKSLSDNDGKFINILKFFPNPEAIRNLVVISAARHDTYRTLHAISSLDYLSGREGWDELVENAIRVYPELDYLRATLQNWKSSQKSEYARNAELNQNASGLGETIYNSLAESSDGNADSLRVLAIDMLDSTKLLEIAVDKGHLSSEDVLTFMDASKLLSERPEASGGNVYFDRVIKDLAVSAVQHTRRHNNSNLRAHTESITKFRHLSILAKGMIDAKDNPAAVEFLTSYTVLEYLTKTSRSTLASAEREGIISNIVKIPERLPALLHEKMSATLSYVVENSDILLANQDGIQFLNRVIGSFGAKSLQIIESYKKCIDAGAISHTDNELVFEFVTQFKILTPSIIKAYKEAKGQGRQELFISQLNALANKMTGGENMSVEDENSPYYQDLLRHVYPNHSNNYANYEGVSNCPDRSTDLSPFSFDDRYAVDLLSQSATVIKEGVTLNVQVLEDIQKPFYDLEKKVTAADGVPVSESLNADITRQFEAATAAGAFGTMDMSQITSQEERLFLLLVDATYGTRAIPTDEIKRLVVTYQFSTFDDIQNYISGTRDRTSLAGNQQYALLCEMGAFYSDRIKEVNRMLVTEAWKNPEIPKIMEGYFDKLREKNVTQARQAQISKLQVDKLGVSDGFIRQIGTVLRKRRGREYSREEILEIIQRYEVRTGGLSPEASTSSDPSTRSLYGQLRSQREKTFAAVKTFTGESPDPKSARLGEMRLDQMLEAEQHMDEGTYDENEFATYTVQRFIDVFESEKLQIETELSKFESKEGKKREVINAFFTKTKASAYARMVGGVCVAGDNEMWNMPNYFQLVLQDPETLQCQGLVLLHHFEQGGKRILTASLNPSSTYLYSVDESALFSGIMTTLEGFASANKFDSITVSQNSAIRTNRTGGAFERALDERIRTVGKQFKFDTPQPFSIRPNEYSLQEMDVVWENQEVVMPS